MSTSRGWSEDLSGLEFIYPEPRQIFEDQVPSREKLEAPIFPLSTRAYKMAAEHRISSTSQSAMLVSSLFTLLLATRVFAALRPATRSCGSTFLEEDRVLLEAHETEEPQVEAAECPLVERIPSLSDHGLTNITLYWHVIQKSENKSEGHITAKEMNDQMEVLNTAYRETGLQFVLAGADYTTNADWFDHLGKKKPQNVDAKKALRQGDKATLNVYSTGFLHESPEFLGYGTYPWHVADELVDDGVVFLWSTIPGGSKPNYNLGHTLTHEVGHWLGLTHTSWSTNGCQTNPETSSSTGSNTNEGCRNSCPSEVIVGPITNYMDDGQWDSCLGSFTSGQVKRIGDQLSLYRGIEAASHRFIQDHLGVKVAQTHFDPDH